MDNICSSIPRAVACAHPPGVDATEPPQDHALCKCSRAITVMCIVWTRAASSPISYAASLFCALIWLCVRALYHRGFSAAHHAARSCCEHRAKSIHAAPCPPFRLSSHLVVRLINLGICGDCFLQSQPGHAATGGHTGLELPAWSSDNVQPYVWWLIKGASSRKDASSWMSCKHVGQSMAE